MVWLLMMMVKSVRFGMRVKRAVSQNEWRMPLFVHQIQNQIKKNLYITKRWHKEDEQKKMNNKITGKSKNDIFHIFTG